MAPPEQEGPSSGKTAVGISPPGNLEKSRVGKIRRREGLRWAGRSLLGLEGENGKKKNNACTKKEACTLSAEIQFIRLRSRKGKTGVGSGLEKGRPPKARPHGGGLLKRKDLTEKLGTSEERIGE